MSNPETQPGASTFDGADAWNAYQRMADGNITVEVSTQAAQAELERLRAENAALQRVPLTRQQIDDVMTEHYPLSSLLREEVDAFEACVRDIERLHGIGA